MNTVVINYWAVLVAAVASMVLGWLWFGPLFGKMWMKLSGVGHEQMEKAKSAGMAKLYLMGFVGSLVMAYVLAYSLVFASAYLNVSGVNAGVMAGFWNWLGFVAPVSLGLVLWEGKSWRLWFLKNAYQLCSLVLMGVILAVWK